MQFLALLGFLFLCGCHPFNLKKEPPSRPFRTCMGVDLASFDPRKGADMRSQTVLTLLYAGLFRADKDLSLQPELAKTYEISNNYRTFIFTLREAVWSDGSPITAYDFERSWKEALSVEKASANTNLLFLIKNGKKVFQGEVPSDQLGIRVLDGRKLLVELESSNPYFLQILSNPVFYPVHQSTQNGPPGAKPSDLICSGAYCLKDHLLKNQISLQKNPLYWNASQIHLKEIIFYVVKNTSTALLMFEKGEIDWLGAPLIRIPYDAIPHLKEGGCLRAVPVAGSQWLMLNTNSFPLNNACIRRALAHAIDREKISQHLMHCNPPSPYFGLIPHVLKKERWHPWMKNHDTEQARIFFAQGLEQLSLTVERFPELALSHGGLALDIAQTVQQMWQETLGIKVRIETTDGATFFQKYNQQDYQVVICGWSLQYNSPISALDIFKHTNVVPNRSGWENKEFIRHTDEALAAFTEDVRWAHLEEAERIFFSEMPSIPYADMMALYLEKPYVQGVSISPLYRADFREARFLPDFLPPQH